MNMLSLAKRYITANLPVTLLQIVTFAAGFAILLIVVNLSSQLSDNFSQGKSKIDSIIGAKGSPLQLVLSGIYHADIATGNIDYNEAIKLSRHKSIKNSTPISLGDSYRGFNIVGTNQEFLKLYNLEITEGRIWKKPMEAIIGYQIAKNSKLKIGDSFVGSHGLVEGGEEHSQTPYKITAIMKESGTIADRLILTDLKSVWEIHEHEEHGEHRKYASHDEHGDHNEHEYHTNEREVTALLVQYNNRAAAFNFPRMVNKQTNMMAASPSFEITRLFKTLGIGFDTAKIIGYILLTISILSIFLVLLNNVLQRQYDIAILRATGAKPIQIMQLVIFEGIILTISGIIFGFLTSHAVLFIIDKFISLDKKISIDYSVVTSEELIIMQLLLIISLVASIIPAIMAYRVNILDLLLKRT